MHELSFDFLTKSQKKCSSYVPVIFILKTSVSMHWTRLNWTFGANLSDLWISLLSLVPVFCYCFASKLGKISRDYIWNILYAIIDFPFKWYTGLFRFCDLLGLSSIQNCRYISFWESSDKWYFSGGHFLKRWLI